MRTVVARLAIVLGVFALVVGAVAIFWGKDAAYRIPLDTDSYTRLTGEASGALAKSDTPGPVSYIVHTQVDPKHSDDDVIAMTQTSCMATTTEYCLDDKGNFVLAQDNPAIVNTNIAAPDKFALDRATGFPVKDQAKYVTDTAAVLPYAGVVVKFPFDVEKKDYDYWDGTLGKAVTATYKGTKKIDGLETYRFDVSIPKQDATIAADTQGSYAATQSVWVDQKTGAFVDQEGTQTVELPDGTKVLDVQVSYTDDTIKANVAKAKDNGQSLFLIDTIARFVAPVVGIILIAVGVFLLRRRTSGSATHARAPRAKQSV